MESLLLSVAHYWSLRETLDRQVELLERHFRQEEMRAAQVELAAPLVRADKLSLPAGRLASLISPLLRPGRLSLPLQLGLVTQFASHPLFHGLLLRPYLLLVQAELAGELQTPGRLETLAHLAGTLRGGACCWRVTSLPGRRRCRPCSAAGATAGRRAAPCWSSLLWPPQPQKE
jgi:hypothetical protein